MPTPVRSSRNQYRGINVHLHAVLVRGGWGGFHTAHISDLQRALHQVVKPLGYRAELEPSIQIRREDGNPGYPRADVAVRAGGPRGTYPSPTAVLTQPMVKPLAEALSVSPPADRDYAALAVRRSGGQQPGDDDIVLWLELLSPSNKSGGPDGRSYRRKRQERLQRGMVFVELDYLIVGRATLRVDEPRFPYYVHVMMPHPDWQQGTAASYGIRMDEALPTALLPLAGEDAVTFDFDRPYQRTVLETDYAGSFVDYTQFPAGFDRYPPDDQARVANRMLAVLRAHRAGLNLEDGPFDPPTLPLPDALRELESLLTDPT